MIEKFYTQDKQLVAAASSETLPQRQNSGVALGQQVVERRRQEVQDTARDIPKKINIEVPDFEGKLDHPTIFSDWLDSIEEYFDWYDMLDVQRVRFAKMKAKIMVVWC